MSPKSIQLPTCLLLTTPLNSAIDRYKLLKDSDFLYDFGKQPSSIANGQTFPALVGSGISMSVGNVDGELSTLPHYLRCINHYQLQRLWYGRLAHPPSIR